MPQRMPSKDPNDILDYTIDWETWLGDDTIVSSTWSVPAGITEVTHTTSATAVTIWLSGGVAGTTYKVTNQITTAAGRTKEDSIYIRGKDR